MDNNYSPLFENSGESIPKKKPSIQKEQKIIVAILGKGAVGKTSLIWKITNKDKTLFETHPTIEDRYNYDYFFHGKKIPIEILDTAGEDDYRNMIDLWIQPSHCVILVYSVDSKNTFTELQEIYERIKKIKEKGYPILMLGNKIDLDDREISTTEGNNLAKEWNINYLETSAKTGANCDKILDMILPELFLHDELHESKRVDSGDYGSYAPSVPSSTKNEKKKWIIMVIVGIILIGGIIGVIVWKTTT